MAFEQDKADRLRAAVARACRDAKETLARIDKLVPPEEREAVLATIDRRWPGERTVTDTVIQYLTELADTVK